MILINLKVYKNTFGDGAVRLAKIAKEISDKSGVRIVVAAAAVDAVRLAETGAEIWLQHFDTNSEGKKSGWVSSLQAMALGIKGSLINHSEHKLARGKVLELVRNKPQGFEVMCAAHSIGQVERWIGKSNTDWILYEPPELIASADKSVATENPEAILHVIEVSRDKAVMVGAGIKSKSDVEIALKMGAKGVGLASAFVLGDDPRAVLEELVAGFRGTI